MFTGREPARFTAELCERLRNIMDSSPHVAFEGIGISVPGRIDLASGLLVFAPNLGWGVIDLKKPLEDATGLSVKLENAANACALAELLSGH